MTINRALRLTSGIAILISLLDMGVQCALVLESLFGLYGAESDPICLYKLVPSNGLIQKICS